MNFEIFQKFPFFDAVAPEFYKDFNSLGNSERGQPKQQSYQVWLNSMQKCGRRCHLKILFTLYLHKTVNLCKGTFFYDAAILWAILVEGL